MTSESSQPNIISKALKKYIITGILVWLPIVVTIWVLTYIVTAADHLVNFLPENWQPETWLGFQIPGLGIVITVFVLFFTGLFAANMLGKKIIYGWDAIFRRIPVVKSIYSSVKKVSDSLLSDSRQSFKTPVLVPFPQADIWTVAFVSGQIPDAIRKNLIQKNPDKNYVSVYVPTTPNPTGGYYIMVKEEDVLPLEMTVDEALKYVISLGMVHPEIHLQHFKNQTIHPSVLAEGKKTE